MKFLRYKCEAKADSINLVIKHITLKDYTRIRKLRLIENINYRKDAAEWIFTFYSVAVSQAGL